MRTILAVVDLLLLVSSAAEKARALGRITAALLHNKIIMMYGYNGVLGRIAIIVSESMGIEAIVAVYLVVCQVCCSSEPSHLFVDGWK